MTGSFRLLLLFLLPAAACATSAPAPKPVRLDPFVTEGAAEILRARTDGAQAEVRRHVAFLNKSYGYVPSGAFHDLRNLRDLLDRKELLAGLSTPSALALGRRLIDTTGWSLDPATATEVAKGAAGPCASALADPGVRALLATLRDRDLLDEKAGQDLLTLSAAQARALVSMAGKDGVGTVGLLASQLPYRFRPSDAEAFERGNSELTEGEVAFARELLARLETDARPGYAPEIRKLAAHAGRARDLFDAAAAAGIRMRGAGSIIILSRLVDEGDPLTEEERSRLGHLAKRVMWPDGGDALYLVPLSRSPGVLDVIGTLADEHRYRFRSRDAADLLKLAREGVPMVTLPDWIEADAVPLFRPAGLLSADPTLAFVDRNDLLFMQGVARHRPEESRRPLKALRSSIRRRMRGVPVMYRPGSPFTETVDSVDRLLRPDLLKASMVLDELSRPEVSARLYRLMREDIADTATERGGHVRLTHVGRLSFDPWEGSATAGRNDRLALPARPEAALEFHFHATDEDDSAFAGPSSGGPGTDIFRAERHQLDGLVLTKVEGDRFDVDLYTSRGVVLDLGIFPRER